MTDKPKYKQMTDKEIEAEKKANKRMFEEYGFIDKYGRKHTPTHFFDMDELKDYCRQLNDHTDRMNERKKP